MRKIAEAAAGTSDPRKGLVLAAQAQNLAALIASDCGLPGQARAMCWQHYDTYQAARPLTGRVARYCLEPLINLARMRIRAGDGAGAFTLLTDLWRTFDSGAPVSLDGRTVCLRGLTATSADRQETQTWLFRALIAEAPRALIRAGQWGKALSYITEHNAVGVRLFEGRQIAIVANCLKGRNAARTALNLLAEAATDTHWEHAVSACLTTLCLTAAGQPPLTTSRMEDAYLRLPAKHGLHMFRAQLGLTVIDLLDAADHPTAGPTTAHLIRDALQSKDGYMAREVLTHLSARGLLTRETRADLMRLVRSSGLDGAGLLGYGEHDLITAASSAELAARRILGTAVTS
ncbi:hypothetical protein [Nonomuraea sp. NPDC050540]|uniref:hypothetical protein n=1 Tax=Nonomuraea sp. NPDC050540 TaxID=3364367 RepID=UPI003798C193